MKPLTFQQRLGWAVRDPYFIIGLALIAVLLLVTVLGPEVSPHNPFLVKRLQWIDGELHKAPIPPGEIYPLGTDDLGRDQLSLLLYGARTTLVMAAVGTIVRLLLGLLLGTFAGWWPGSAFDRTVTALTGLLAAIPALILAMLLVFAVGIRRGQIAFIAALSLVGWGEIAQIVRGHVLSIRNELYIVAARAVGLSPAGILSRHVLPNLLATLLALASLEMGGVLLLLGELGFVHVFIGGGRLGFEMASFEAHHYFDMPDWGAMLGTSWRWFRSYPWFPVAPALAFFVAILGFNLFGYGLQRFVERGRFHPSGWSVLRFFLVTALILLGARALLQSASIEAQFARLARQFDANRAWDDIAYLARPEADKGHPLEGRAAGSDGEAAEQVPRAAAYIAAQFERAGLTPISPDGSYTHLYTAIRGRITGTPILEVLDTAEQVPGGEPQLQLSGSISLDPRQAFHAERDTVAECVVMGNARGTVMQSGILLMLDPEERLEVPWHVPPPYAAVLRIVPDDQLGSNDQPPPFDRGRYADIEGLPEFPNLLIAASAARQVLAMAGMDLEALQAAMETGQTLALPTGLQMHLQVGLRYEEVPAANVIGYIPGMDRESHGERILVTATYAGRPAQDGAIYPGADENASGVAVMLETARLLHDLEWIPKRTVVFAAFDEGGGGYFVTSPAFPTTRSDIWTTLILHGLGAGEARLSRMESGIGLARAFDQSARRFRVRTEQLDAWQFFFVSNNSRLSYGSPASPESYQALAVTRTGDGLSGTPADTIDHLDMEQLKAAGQAVAHFVMVASSR